MNAILKSSTYKTAGETHTLKQLNAIIARLEKGASLDAFQIDTLRGLLDKFATVAVHSDDPLLVTTFVAMKAMLDHQRKDLQKAQQSEQDYMFGMPAVDTDGDWGFMAERTAVMNTSTPDWQKEKTGPFWVYDRHSVSDSDLEHPPYAGTKHLTFPQDWKDAHPEYEPVAGPFDSEWDATEWEP